MIASNSDGVDLEWSPLALLLVIRQLYNLHFRGMRDRPVWSLSRGLSLPAYSRLLPDDQGFYPGALVRIDRSWGPKSAIFTHNVRKLHAGGALCPGAAFRLRVPGGSRRMRNLFESGVYYPENRHPQMLAACCR